MRVHEQGQTLSTAEYSPCLGWRYSLTRVWDPDAPRITFVMLNPSTATERQNDPTVARCERRARRLGFGGYRVCNIFAFRATDPRALQKVADPIGPENDAAILEGALWSRRVVCAWGAHGQYLGRGGIVRAMLVAQGVKMFHLGLAACGEPRHPLYVSYNVPLMPWG